MKAIRLACRPMAFVLSIALLAPAGFAATGALHGTVRDPLGAVVRGAAVELLRDGQPVNSTVTDNEGGYRFSSVPAGHYVVRANAATFAPQMSPSIYVGGVVAAEADLTLNIGPIAQQIVVSATGTREPVSQVGASVSVLSSGQFQERLDVLEPLRQAPGAQIVQTGGRGGTASLFVRGGDSDANKVLVDGVPINDIGGQAEFADVATIGVERIEVLGGPNSSLYGSDALASVVNLTTRRGATLVPELSYAFDAGNFNSLRNDAALAGAFRKIDYFSEFSRFDTGNGIPHDTFHNASYAGNFGWTPNAAVDVRLTVRHSNAAVGVPNAIDDFGIPDNAFQRDQDTYIGLTAQDQTTSKWHNLLRYGGTRLRSQFEQVSPAGVLSPVDGTNFLGNLVTLHGGNGFSTTGQAILDFAPIPPATFPITSSFSTKRDFGYFQTDYSFSSRLLALFGFKYEHERGFDLVSGTPEETTQRHNLSYTGELQGNLGRAYATLGGGVENNTVFGVAATPRASLAYYLVRPKSDGAFNGTKLKFNYGQGIKEPSIFQQTTSLFGLLSSLNNGPQLIAQFHVAPIGAERSRSYDAGFEQSAWNGRARLNAAFFYNQFTNQVQFVPNLALPLLGVPRQIAAEAVNGAAINSQDTRALGAETALEFSLGHGFTARAAYTYLDAVVQRSFSNDALSPSFNPAFPAIPIGAFAPLVGSRPFGRAPHSGNFFVQYAQSRYMLSLSGALIGRRDDSTFLTDANFGTTMLLPNRNLDSAYQKIDLAGSFRFNRRLDLYTSIENLASEHYDAVFGFPALPLAVRAGFKITLGGESWK